MSLMSRIGRKLVAAPKPKPEAQLRVAINKRNAELNPSNEEFLAQSAPPPRAKSAETRQRMSESQKRRYAKSDPVPTSALPTPPSPIAPKPSNELRWAMEATEAAARDVAKVDAEEELAHFVPESAKPLPFITPPPLPPVPPRAELEVDLVKSLEALPLPALPEPVIAAPPSTTSRGSCKARNPATGIQCALLAGHTKLHRHGSTEFRFGAAPGTSAFPRRDALEVAANGRNDSPFTTT